MSDAPVPYVLAFLIGDQVIEEAGTKKKTVVGIHDHIGSMVKPVRSDFGIYARLADGEGKYKFLIRLANLKTEEPVFDFEVTKDWPKGQTIAEVCINLRGMPIPDFGKYELQLFANGVYIGRHVIICMELKPPSKKE